MKTFSSTVFQRMEAWVDLEDDQASYRCARSVYNQIFILNSICEETLSMAMYVYLAFIEFSSDFDTINHSKLWNILRK